MLKKMIYGTALLLGLMFTVGQSKVFSQEMTKEEQKLMEKQIKDAMKNEDYLKRQAKLDELLSKPPATCGLESIDGLAINSKAMLVEQKSTNDLLKTYVGKLIPDDDGNTTVQDGKKITADDILQLSTGIGKQLLAVTDALAKVTAVAGDVTKLSPMKVPAGKKSLGYTKDVLQNLGDQLKAQMVIIKNLSSYSKAKKSL